MDISALAELAYMYDFGLEICFLALFALVGIVTALTVFAVLFDYLIKWVCKL